MPIDYKGCFGFCAIVIAHGIFSLRTVHAGQHEWLVVAAQTALEVNQSKLVFMAYLDQGNVRAKELRAFLWSLEVC